MNKTLFRILLFVLPCVTTTAHGMPPSQCINLSSRADGGVALKNTCNAKLNVSFCVENPKSSFACKRNSSGKLTGGGSYHISPGNEQSIPFYKSDGGGSVRWAACRADEGIINWSLSGYDCK